jgi:hypothetical protein
LRGLRLLRRVDAEGEAILRAAGGGEQAGELEFHPGVVGTLAKERLEGGEKIGMVADLAQEEGAAAQEGRLRILPERAVEGGERALQVVERRASARHRRRIDFFSPCGEDPRSRG